MQCSQEARRWKLISFTVLSYFHSSFSIYLFAMHCTMLSPHVMPLYSVYGLKYVWQLRSSSVTTAFTQETYPLTLVTSAFPVRSLCFMSRGMTQLIAYYAYIWNGMKGNQCTFSSSWWKSTNAIHVNLCYFVPRKSAIRQVRVIDNTLNNMEK